MKSNFEIGSYQFARFHALGPHLVELPGAGRLRIQVAVELGEMCAPGGSVGLVLAHIFLAELDGELNSSALVLSELSLRPPTLSFQDLAKLPFLPLSLCAAADPPTVRLPSRVQAGQGSGATMQQAWLGLPYEKFQTMSTPHIRHTTMNCPLLT